MSPAPEGRARPALRDTAIRAGAFACGVGRPRDRWNSEIWLRNGARIPNMPAGWLLELRNTAAAYFLELWNMVVLLT